ncbi:hypothetical protein ACWEO2_08740 [Nocardia sp. NPDC004278]
MQANTEKGLHQRILDGCWAGWGGMWNVRGALSMRASNPTGGNRLIWSLQLSPYVQGLIVGDTMACGAYVEGKMLAERSHSAVEYGLGDHRSTTFDRTLDPGGDTAGASWGAAPGQGTGDYAVQGEFMPGLLGELAAVHAGHLVRQAGRIPKRFWPRPRQTLNRGRPRRAGIRNSGA